MTTKPRGPELAIVTTAWLAFLGVLLVVLAPQVDAGGDRLARADRGASAAQEPPPAPSLWERIGSATRALLLPRPVDPTREAVAHALESLGVPDWHRADRRGKGVKVCVLDSGFRGYRQALGKVLPAAIQTRSFRRDGK